MLAWILLFFVVLAMWAISTWYLQQIHRELRILRKNLTHLRNAPSPALPAAQPQETPRPESGDRPLPAVRRVS